MVITFRRAGATTWSSISAITRRAAGARGRRRRRWTAGPATRPTPRARGRPARRGRHASTGGRRAHTQWRPLPEGDGRRRDLRGDRDAHGREEPGGRRDAAGEAGARGPGWHTRPMAATLRCEIFPADLH